MKKYWIARAARIVIFAALGILLLGLVIMTLWNSLIPALFSGPAITFWQALGLFALSRVLFFSFRPWGGWGYWSQQRGEYFRKQFEEKLSRMTPEERERFKSRYYSRCGSYWNRMPKEETVREKETVEA